MASITKITTQKGTGYRIDYYDLDQRKRRKTVYCSREKAENIAKALEGKKANVRLGLDTAYKNSTSLKDAIDYYLGQARRQKKASTIEREKYVYNAFSDYVGESTEVGKIKVSTIAGYKQYRLDEDEISPATMDIELRKLSQFFGFLVTHEIIEKNPAKRVKSPKLPNEEIRFLSPDEIESLLKAIDDQNYKDLILAYLHTGARKAELLPENLQWKDIDLKSREIRLHGKGDKTRWVPINKTLYKILKRRKFQEKRSYPFNFNYNYMPKKFKNYVEDAELEDITLHDLRRTYGSLLVQNGVDIFTVSKLLGHSSVQVTEKHYAALIKKNLTDGVKVLDDLI